jgi:predicted CXXCH cytochrome family protein
MRRVIYIMAALFVFVGSIELRAAGRSSVVNSKHNLSVSGPGEIKSASETRVCIFCHASHRTSKEGALWNHKTTDPRQFTTYDRATLSTRPDQPNGATKLCLSCHDGTIAVGAIKGLSRPIPMTGVNAAGQIPSTRKSSIGTDLSGTHPVSIRYRQETAAASSHLRWPPVDPEGDVGPDSEGFVQCTSCHDPHDDSKSDKYPFWQKQSYSEVCVTCHEL